MLAPAVRKAIRHAGLWIPVAAYMAVIFYLSSQSDPLPALTAAVWDKALHFIEFSGLAVLLGRAFLGEGASNRWSFVAALVATSLYAASDELHQVWVQGRSAGVDDWLAGSLGGLAGSTVAGAVAGVQQAWKR
jgi:VanZ family protein